MRRVVQSPYRFSAARSGVRRGASYRGEHNREVVREWLDLTLDEVAKLEEVGVLLTDKP